MTELSLLSNDALEVMASDYLVAGDIDGEELCLLEMLRRDDFVASTAELEYTLECWG